MQNYYYRFADVYGSGPYSEGVYGCTQGQAGCAASSGSLINTGVAIAGVVTLACLVVFVALLVRFARRRKKTNLANDNTSGHQAE